MKKITLIIAALALITISSCKKEEEAAKTNTDHLTTSPWKMSKMTINPGIDFGNGILVTDLYAFQEACSKDDTEKFNVGGTGVTNEGATKCDPTDPQTTPFAWAFASSESKLIFDGDTFNIATLNASTLNLTTVIDGTELGGDPGNHTISVTFGK
jgi:hypothetical protein